MQLANFKSQYFKQSKSLLSHFLMILMGSVVLAAASQISIPWSPVPLTFQSAMVVLLGLMMGARKATAVVALYLFEAAIGLPVLAGFSGGLPVLMGITAGYLFGFLPAAFVTGTMMTKGMSKTFIGTFISSVIGAAIMFACGVTHLSLFIGMHQAVALGFTPFVVTEVVKLFIIAIIARVYWKK